MPASPVGTEITAVRQIALTVSDVARATAFYRDALGLRFLFSASPNLAFLDIGGVRLMLAGPEGDFTPGLSSILYLQVADIGAATRCWPSVGSPSRANRTSSRPCRIMTCGSTSFGTRTAIHSRSCASYRAPECRCVSQQTDQQTPRPEPPRHTSGIAAALAPSAPTPCARRVETC